MFNKLDIKLNRIIPLIIFLGVFLFVSTEQLFAATLSLSSSSQSVSLGNIVSVKVLVNTSGKSINNSDGVIQYPSDLLDVLSVSKTSSIFSLWVEEPKFSNSNGTISFNGGVPSPGFAGSYGEVMSITFKAKKSGNASIIFSEASVRENDGLGTDILTSKSGATINIDSVVPVIAPEKTVEVINKNTAQISTPIVQSSTHPKQDVWYSGRSASFSWSVPAGVTSVQATLNASPLSVPTVSYDGSVSRKTLNDVLDGTYYFNLRLRNSLGWSNTAHYKVLVDSTPPKNFVPEIREDDSRNIVTLNASDETSGIDYYMIGVDSDTLTKVSKDKVVNDEYLLPIQNGGNHTLTVIAYDKARNSKEAKISFVSPEIVSPSIEVSPSKIEVGDSVNVKGRSIYKNQKIEILFSGDSDEKKYQQITNNDGVFDVSIDDIDIRGRVAVTARIMASDSLFSKHSDVVYITVGDPKIIKDITKYLYPVFGIVSIVFLTMLFVYLLYLGWHKFFNIKQKYREEFKVVIDDIHDTMISLKKELGKQLKTLEDIKKDRELNKKEEKIFNDIKDNIDSVEEFIEKKIKKIL
jgi:hypothetical protein